MQLRFTAPILFFLSPALFAQTVVFQENGVSSYTGTNHRIIAEEAPSVNFTGEIASIDTNTEDYTPGVFGESQGLFKFDNIFGSETGQVPLGSFIVAAELTTFSNNGTDGPISLHQLLSSWDPGTVSWNSFVNGIHANNLEAKSTPEDTKSGIGSIATLSWDVRTSVRSWSDGNPNNGWVFISQTPDAWDVFTELYSTNAGQRPRLSITYSSAPPNIYDVEVTNFTASSATINWKTTSAANSVVNWGLSAGSLPNQVSEAPLVTNHSIILTSLPADTTIYYQISSTDGGSFNENKSGDFHTEEGDFDIVRGPYLQNGSTSFVTVRWRTGMEGNSVVHYGTNIGNLNQTATNPVPDTKHEIELTSLTENTRYYYQIETEFTGGGSTFSSIQSDTFFDTSPSNGDDKTTLWVIGDSGTGNSEAASVYNGFKGLFGPGEIPHADVWLMLGDNAYNKGTDAEFQNAVFDMYPELLRNSVLWPALGNHEALTPGATPFFEIFTMPEAGEAGGVASSTEKYFSFDYGNIHFICLDSETAENYSDIPGGGGMIDWLEADLIANTKDWTIAFFHHGPYTKGSHDSDSEIRHTSMRDYAIPLLESYGVDLTLTGHSHIYERSAFITGHHGLSSHSSTFNPASYLSGGNVVDGGNGSLIGEVDPFGNFLSNPALGEGPYSKPTISSDDGTVYVTAGASGSLKHWASGSNALVNPVPHPVHLVNLRLLGSLYIEVNRYTMDVSYVGTDSSIRDNFTISKGSYLETQTEVDNFSATHETGVVEGNLIIRDDGSDPIVDLDGLSGLSYVGGDLIIENNQALASFCGLYPFYDTGTIDGNIIISGNAANPTTAEILANGLCETIDEYYDVAVTNFTASSATINWKTTSAANSVVNWGLSAGSLPNQVSEAPLVTNHSIILTSLPADTTIYYQISSTDGGSFNENKSGDFHTEEGDFDIVRGPYLQNGSTSFVTVRWRTGMEGNSVVHYGTNIGNLNQTATNPVPDTKHEIELTSLTENTRYYYQIETEFTGGGSTFSSIQSDTFFDTSPSNGDDKTTLWVIGDSGTGNSEAASVYNGFKGLFGPGEIPHADVWLMLGDNAYNKGTDAEFQNAVFDMYPELLRNSVLWPALGNHEAISPGAAPFFNLFTMPEAGEAGGVASGTERYYSFDYGNIHFICLDSETDGNCNDAPGAPYGMVDWLEDDLQANTKDWIITYFHHGPYTKGSHDSDSENHHKRMRDYVIPLLESYGVDLTLTGHSHQYERSAFITGHHGLSSHSSTFNPTHYLSGGNMVDEGNGSLIGEVNSSGSFISNPALGEGPYHKPTVSSNNGTVYVTAGASGRLKSWASGSDALVNPVPHPVHLVNLRLLGSLYIEVNRYTMDVSYVGTDSSIRDNFTISKGSYLETQTEVDNFSATHETGVVEGNLIIRDDGSDPIVDLDGLSGLSYVGGDLIIENNQALASFCGLYPFYDTGTIDGNIIISGNAANPTTAEILANGLCETIDEYYDVAVTNFTASSATINWKTTSAANSVVNWGLSAGSLPNQVSEAPLVTNHSIILTSLPADTTIYYQISSTDGGSFNENKSGDFHTEEGDFDIVRGPYLQNGSTSFVTVRWRTGMEGNSVVNYGTDLLNLNQTTTIDGSRTDHEVKISSLTNDTRYYYQIRTEYPGGGSTFSPIQNDTFVDTSPTGNDQVTTLWVIGDSGTGNSEAASVYNGFKGLFGPGEIPHADVWLMLGDNAYDIGSEPEFQAAVFDMYPELLRNSVLWPALGNHEALTPGATPFFEIFTMPTAGEAGGVASSTERYFSFDYGNIHFICLDSETDGNYNDAPGAPYGMVDWLEDDLQANTKDWIIAYFHHGPYTKGSHDSDSENHHIRMRDYVIPLLESYGVDLTLTGHSHQYERSAFITGHHGLNSHSSTFNPASYLSEGNVVDGGNGSLIGEVSSSGSFISNPALGDGPYHKPTVSSNDGTVYVTAGASGRLRSWASGSDALANPVPHPVHLVNLRLLGSLYIEVNRYTMDVNYVGTDSSIRDNFTISKGSYLETQTEVDNFSATHGTGAVNGNLTILDDDDGSDPIVDLDGLSALNYVGGDLIIENNGALASFCGLYPFYDTGSIDGNIFISGNIANPTSADILSRGLCETYEDYYDYMASFYLGATSQSVIGISADPDADFISNLQEWAYGLNPSDAGNGGLELDGLTLITPGLPVVYLASASTGVDFSAVYGRLIDWETQNLEYKVQFSNDLNTWYDSSDIPTYLDSNGTIDLVSVPYPIFLPDFTKAKFFRVVVSFAP